MSAEQPIEGRHRDAMNAVAEVLGELFVGYGFALFVFEFGDHPGQRMNYISNARRGDMLVAMKEFISNAEFGEQEGRA